MTDPTGVLAVYVIEDRVAASAADFAEDKYSGFSLFESQRIRATDKAARAVLEAYCSPVVANALDTYHCKQVVEKMPGAIRIIPIGHEDGVEYE